MTREEFGKYQYDALDFFMDRLDAKGFHIIEPMLLQTLGYLYDVMEAKVQKLEKQKSCTGCIYSFMDDSGFTESCKQCARFPYYDRYEKK